MLATAAAPLQAGGAERDGSSFKDRQHAPPPRLPNGSGLVRKRKFVPPARIDGANGNGTGGNKFPGSAALGANNGASRSSGGGGGGGGRRRSEGVDRGGGGFGGEGEEELPEELQHLEKAMVDKIVQEIQQRGDPVSARASSSLGRGEIAMLRARRLY